MPAVASFSTSPDRPKAAIPLDATPGEQAQDDQGGQSAAAVDPTRSLHHGPLRCRPILLPGEQPDVRPFLRRGQVAVLGLGSSRAPSDPPAAIRPAPAGSPSACGSASPGARGRGSRGSVGSTARPGETEAGSSSEPVGVSGRDQPQFVVEDVDQVGEFTGTVGISRCLLQFPF